MKRKREGVHKRGTFLINFGCACWAGLAAYYYGIHDVLAIAVVLFVLALAAWIGFSVLEKLVRE